MNDFGFRNAPSMVADLDGWSFRSEPQSYAPRGKSYLPDTASNNNHPTNDDFGFDPPTAAASVPSVESRHSPNSVSSMDGLTQWSQLQSGHRNAPLQRIFEQPLVTKQLPYATSAVSRHGQITPPRSDSATSSVSIRTSIEAESMPMRKKRSTKVEIKQEAPNKTDAPSTSTKKRKASRKSTNASLPTKNPEDEKRKLSLEKNRLAAAKCRINKKEKTDQLQHDSHDKAVENTFLRQTIMQMKEEVQQLQTILMSHSSSDQCKNPESIHEALGAAGPDSFANQMANNHFLNTSGQQHPQDVTMGQLGHDQGLPGDYFQSHETPALPEFNLSADFVVRTPMLDE